MRQIKLTEAQLSELYALHKRLKDKKAAYRINIIILLHRGYSYQEIQEVLLIDEKTIRRYKDTFIHRGIEGLLENNYNGGQPKLSKEQEDDLVRYLEENIMATAAEVCHFVKKQFGILFTAPGMVHTLHRLGFSYKKTKIVPAKANREEQEAFVKAYQQLRKQQKPTEKVYFMDGVHPTHNVMPAYAWIKKGTEKEVKSNSGRQRLNINGVYSPDDGEIIIREDAAIDSESTIRLLKTIEKKHPELTTIYVVRDNARYYVSREVKEYLENSRIVFIPLPSYSPNLNPIERLWKFFKKKKLYNLYYDSFDIFKKEVLKFFRYEIKSYKRELDSLLTENFHIFNTT
jgi:transposase